MSNSAKKLLKAKIDLIEERPFFGTVITYLDFVENSKIESAGVSSRGQLFYNPKYVDSLSQIQTKVLLCHEVMHLVLEFFSRRNGRDFSLWNTAHDYAINWILSESNMMIPSNWKFDDRFADMSAEEIYNIISGGLTLKDYKWGLNNSGCIHPEDTGVNKEESVRWKRITQSAYRVAKNSGKISSELDRLLDSLLHPKLPWNSLLKRFVRECVKGKDDFSWLTPNRRFDHPDELILPELSGDRSNIVNCIDVSGSISESGLQKFISELRGIIDDFGENTRTILVDNKIHEEIYSTDIKEICKKLKGGGGTDFTSVFRYLEHSYPPPSGIIFFTDLYADGIPPISPNCQTLWITTKDHGPLPKWGQTIIMEKE